LYRVKDIRGILYYHIKDITIVKEEEGIHSNTTYASP